MSERRHLVGVCEDCGESTVSEKLPRCLCEPKKTPEQEQMEATIERLVTASRSRDLRKGFDQAFEELHRAIGAAEFVMCQAVKPRPAPEPETKCTECDGLNVQVAMWVRPNTGETLEMPSSDYDCARAAGLAWCEDCEEHTLLADLEARHG